MKIVFFKTPAAFRTWLQRHHTEHRILHVGFRKRHTGKPSITWPEAVDEALCFGWIDGIRRRVDDESYTIRFTPRRPRSVWSTINTRRVADLEAEGRMTPAGLAAFRARDPERTRLYSYEARHHTAVAPELQAELRANPAAWRYFQDEAPWYRRAVSHWIMSAKKEETRRSRMATLIADCAAGRRIKGVPARR